MIVILVNHLDPFDEEYITDVACVVVNDAPNSSRICWEGGREDRWVDMKVYQLSVVPS